MKMAQITLLRRTLASSPYCECASYRQQGHAGSKTLLQQNPSATGQCRLYCIMAVKQQQQQ